jgi:polar amino acid transport system substrate-binding protein
VALAGSPFCLAAAPLEAAPAKVRSMASPALPAASAEVRRDLAPDGRLKVAINLGNAVLAARDPASGALSGVSVDLARAIGQALGVPVDMVPFVSAGETFDGLGRGEWTLGFMAVDPLRAEKARFTTPYVVIEGTYMVRADAPWREPAELDHAGARIAVARGSAYDLFLSRSLKNAALVRTVTTADAIALYRQGGLDAVGGVRQALTPTAAKDPAYRVMPGRFMRIEQAVAVAAGHEAGAAWADRFIRAAMANGLVRRTLVANGQSGDLVAPLPAADARR